MNENDILKRDYWCFISYRHADNKEPGRQWATWLHQALETYEVPVDLVGTQNENGEIIPERIFPVFRDEEDLPTNAELSRPIESALKHSRFLVVLCSPRSAGSRFVADEITKFKQFGKQDRILAAIIDGEPNASDDESKGGAEKECFPLPLRFGVDAEGRLTEHRTEPIAADFRLSDGQPGWTSPAAYREKLKRSGTPEKKIASLVSEYSERQNLMLLKIVAGILGVPLGTLTKRDKAYQLKKQKQRAKVLRRWLVAVVGLAVVAAGLGWRATVSERRAVSAEADAIEGRDRALKAEDKAVDTLALSYYDRGIDLAKQGEWRRAMTYVARALRMEPDSPLYSRMAYSLLMDHVKEVPVLPPWEFSRLDRVVFSPGRDRGIVCTMGSPSIVNFLTGQSQNIQLPPASTRMTLGASFSRSGGMLISDGQQMLIWNKKLGDAALPDSTIAGGLMMPMEGSPEKFAAAYLASEAVGMLVGSGGRQGVVLLANLEDKKSQMLEAHEGEIVDGKMVPGTSLIITVAKDKTLVITDMEKGEAVNQINLTSVPTSLAVSSKGNWIAVGDQSGRVLIFSMADPSKTWEAKRSDNNGGDVRALVFTQDGERLIGGYDGPGDTGRGLIWSTGSGQRLTGELELPQRVRHVAVDPAGERVAFQTDGGNVNVYDPAGRLLSTFSSGEKPNGLEFVQDGKALAVASDESKLQVFNPRLQPQHYAWGEIGDSIESFSINESTGIAALVLDDGSAWQLWSINTLKPMGPVISMGDDVLELIHTFGEGDQCYVVLTLENGTVKVVKTDGSPIAERIPGGSIMEAMMQINPDNADAPKEVEVNFGHSDSVFIDEAHSRLVEARAIFSCEAALALVLKLQAAGTVENDIMKAFADPKAGIWRGELRFRNLPNLEIAQTLHSKEEVLIDPKVSKDGNLCCARKGRSGMVMLWKRKGQEWEEVKLPLPDTELSGVVAISDVEISPSGRWMALIQNTGAKLLDIQSSSLQWVTLAEGSRVKEIAFSPDEKTLALDISSSWDAGRIQLWNLQTLQPASGILNLRGGLEVMKFSPDSQLVMTATDGGALELWDIASGRQVMQPVFSEYSVNVAQFIQNGKVIAFGGNDFRLGLLAVPPGTIAPSWVPDALESLGGASLDQAGNSHVTSAKLLFDIQSQMLAADGTGDLWSELAHYLWRKPAAKIPGTTFLVRDAYLAKCEEAWNFSRHNEAFAGLKDYLVDYPDTKLSGEMERLATLVKLPKKLFSTVESLDGRKAGETRIGPHGIKFRWCPPGQFVMGSPTSEVGRNANESQHQISLTRGFWVSETEVTQGQWEKVMGVPAVDHMMQNLMDPAKFTFGNNKPVTVLEFHNLKSPDEIKTWSSYIGVDRPMTFVTWNDAQRFCKQYNQLLPDMKITGFDDIGGACRLPTEAEWEYACRAGTSTATYLGDPEYVGRSHAVLLGKLAWYSGNSSDGYTGPGVNSSNWIERESVGDTAGIHPVGLKEPNAWGIHDMLGNVSEWTQDSFREILYDSTVNPSFAGNDVQKVVRGGSFDYIAKAVRAANRSSEQASWRMIRLGFRIVLLDGEELAQSATDGPQPYIPTDEKAGNGKLNAFYFNYGSGDADAGIRLWFRLNPNIWVEQYPDPKKTSQFEVLGSMVLDGDSGELARRQELENGQWVTKENFEVFIPSASAVKPRLWFRHRDGEQWGEWNFLADVTIGKP